MSATCSLRLRAASAVLAAGVIVLGAMPGAAAAEPAQYGAFTFAGGAGAYTGTVALAPGFPATTFTSTSRAGNVGVQTGATTYLPAGSPPGAVFGSSAGSSYLNLRPAADDATAPSVTTYTFSTPTPTAGWVFVLGDIDADAATVSATAADGSAVPVTGLGFAGVFNYCDASPRPSTCSGLTAPYDLPTWDAGSATLTGNLAATDTKGAAGWFTPTVALTTLTITFRWRAGAPVYQTWFASLTRSVTGTVTDPVGTGVDGAKVDVLDAADHVVATDTTDAAGRFDVVGVAPGEYVVRVDPPAGDVVVGPATHAVDVTRADAAGIRFSARAAVVAPPPPPASTTSRPPTSTSAAPSATPSATGSAAGAGLAATGSAHTAPLTGLGVTLLLAGAAVSVSGRRRRRHD